MSDARERRRQLAQQKKSGPGAKVLLRRFMVPIVIVLIAGAIIGYNVAAARGAFGLGDDGCPGHWHAGYSVWDGEQQVPFSAAGPSGDQAGSPGAGFHIHANDGILHFHPAIERCIALEDALAKLGIEVTSDSLTIRGETREANETHDVVVYHQPWDGEWRRVTSLGSFLDDQTGNGDRIMIAYMAQDSQLTVEQRQQQTTDLAGGSYDPGEATNDGSLFIAITMTVVFAGLAIGIWYNFAKKTW